MLAVLGSIEFAYVMKLRNLITDQGNKVKKCEINLQLLSGNIQYYTFNYIGISLSITLTLCLIIA